MKLAKPRTRLAAALRRLETALADDPRDFALRVRTFVSAFHDYSPLNRGLIFLQKPTATFLKGRQQWAAAGRRVKRGARAVQILAPTLKRGERSLTRRFTTVKVYDVSDTEGTSFVVPVLSPDTRGQEERVAELLGQLTEWVLRSGLGLRLESPEINNAVDGATDGRTIWIRPDLTDADRLLVLSHEIAHVKLHFRKKQRGHSLLTDNTGQALSRDTRELEAELTAFLLLAFAGIDSSRGSAAYLNCWNASAAEIRSHAEKVFVVACCVLRDCEKKRYHKLVDEGVATIVNEARAAIE